MHLKTSLGSAYIHNLDLVDKSKEVILFVPGAGMDHRVADLFHPNPEIYNKVIAIDETPIILNATQTPVLKNNKSTEIKKILKNISVIIKTF